jgi:hypothetical protein
MPLRGVLSTGLPNAAAADMDASIEAMVRGMEGPPLAIYDQLGEMLAALPPPVPGLYHQPHIATCRRAL